MEPGKKQSTKLSLLCLGLRETTINSLPRGLLKKAARPAGTAAAPRREGRAAPNRSGATGRPVRAGPSVRPRAAALSPGGGRNWSGAPSRAHHRDAGGGGRRAFGISGWVLRHIRAAEMPVRRAGGCGGLGLAAPPGLIAPCGAREPSGPWSGGGWPGPLRRRRPPLRATGRPPPWGRAAHLPAEGGAEVRGGKCAPAGPGRPPCPRRWGLSLCPLRAAAGVLPAQLWAARPGSSARVPLGLPGLACVRAGRGSGGSRAPAGGRWS